MAEVQILMGTLNGASLLGPQLASFAGQTLRNWTLLASDDGSSDGTLDLLNRFGAARPATSLRILHGPRKGLAANYLHLMHHADDRARFVALSDQDDIWFPEKLQRGTGILRDLPGAIPAIYAARSRLIDQFGRPLGTAKRRTLNPSFSNALVQNVMAGNTIILNRAAMQLVRRALPCPLPPFHDWWLYALISGAGGQVICDPTAVIGYRQHARGYLGAHAGPKARISRLGLIADGTWRGWVRDHHRALLSVSEHLQPAHHRQLRELVTRRSGVARFELICRTGIHRQSASGTAALGLFALTGLL